MLKISPLEAQIFVNPARGQVARPQEAHTLITEASVAPNWEPTEKPSLWALTVAVADRAVQELGRCQLASDWSTPGWIPGQAPVPYAMGADLRPFLTALGWSLMLAVSNALSTVTQLGRLAQRLLNSLHQTRAPGPLMKALLAPLMLASLGLLPVVALLGSACYGLSRGFQDGYQNGVDGSWTRSLVAARKFNRNSLEEAVSAVEEALEDPARLGLPL